MPTTQTKPPTECVASRQSIRVADDVTRVACPMCESNVRVHRSRWGAMISTHQSAGASL